ncbi:hypothetical protein J5N97_011448 [Dioscorea zingiberensis]|uniref:C3H1-type domain-containing protein n=1 Tax=Dioscorea zingiberensis TaxID=325984 RepID=A0A9D5HNM5_9LILI|nr:hypothetical protein J5N97_011448 [Dioscorea zingiberensis]
MAEYHVAADNPESLSPLREDDFHRGKDPRMDFSSKYPRQTKYSKTKAVNEDVSKCLKMANASQDTASGRETHFNRKTDNWSSSHGVEAVALQAWFNSWICRRENRGRTRGGLAVHGRDFSDSKDDAKRSNWEDMTALQPTRRSGITHKESKGLFPALDPNDDLGRNISPGFEPRRQHIYNINPRHGCSQSERNWETASGDQTANEDGNSTRHSGGWGAALDQFEEWEGKISADQRWQRRSHSISPKHSWYTRKRSRSPSPSLGLKPGTESWNNRGRTGTGGSAAPYRDFPTEKFGKGSHFRELGEDDAWRHSDNLSREIGESRFGRGGYSGYHGWEDFNDSLEGKDYSRDRLLQRELSHHDSVWEKLERHKNNRSTEHHYVSTKERFPRGSSCNYVHHDVNSYGPWPMRDGARDRNYDRRDADSPFRQRFKSRRVSDTPCKFFAEGQCRRGEDCKFSHHLLHGHAKGRQQGDRRDHNKRSENASSLNGPKWGNRASIDDAPVSSHEMRNGDDTRFTNPSSMDGEVSRKPEDAQSHMLEKGASQAASLSPEQIITQDACEQHGSAVSAHMMIMSSHMEQIISNKEQVSGKGGCAVGDNTRSEPEIDSATIPSAAVSFTEKNFSRIPHEQPLDPELHSSAPNVQYMEVAPLSPSGQILQETVCTMPPNGDTQLGICQVPSPVNKQMHSASQVGPDHLNSHPILISDDESEQDADNSNKGTSHVTSGTKTSEVLVIGGEVASVTNLSLSLSQVCQQPSQLQATVNPIGAAGSVLPEMASKPSSMSPPSLPLDCGQGFPMLHLTQMPVSDSSCKDAYLDENRWNDNLELKQVDHVGGAQVREVDDGNKKIKETNGMKMFKFALVEFVKDQLKPTWKEGHLSREAHKAIVKKVVDKVTSSMKGPNFPQTQQKVNLYMEHSKLKLSKLVQAYVARSIKS